MTIARVAPAPIGPELAMELIDYKGQWVAIVAGHVHLAGATAVEVAENVPAALDPIIFRVPRQSLAAFLGVSESCPVA